MADETMTPEAATQYLEQAKSDPQLRGQILNGNLNNAALDRWNKAIEITHANPPAAPKPPPAPQPGTAAAVRADIDRLVYDPKFVSRPDARGELEKLLQKERDLTPTAPIVDPTVPADPAMYAFHTAINNTPEATQQAADLRQIAHVAGLSASEFTEISAQAARDIDAHANMSEDEIIGLLDDDLRKIFGERYEEYGQAGRRLIGEIEAARPGTVKILGELGLQHNKVLLTAICQRGMMRYRGKK